MLCVFTFLLYYLMRNAGKSRAGFGDGETDQGTIAEIVGLGFLFGCLNFNTKSKMLLIKMSCFIQLGGPFLGFAMAIEESTSELPLHLPCV